MKICKDVKMILACIVIVCFSVTFLVQTLSVS